MLNIFTIDFYFNRIILKSWSASLKWNKRSRRYKMKFNISYWAFDGWKAQGVKKQLKASIVLSSSYKINYHPIKLIKTSYKFSFKNKKNFPLIQFVQSSFKPSSSPFYLDLPCEASEMFCNVKKGSNTSSSCSMSLSLFSINFYLLSDETALCEKKNDFHSQPLCG